MSRLALAYSVCILLLTAIAQPVFAQDTIPPASPVVVVMLENHSYSQVIGNKNLPYLNSLAKTGALATNYYANTHPSIGNYFLLTTGSLVTRNDLYTGTTTVDTIAHELTAKGKTWHAYAEGLPSIGYIGGNTKRYLKRHNPFAYFSDVRSIPAERKNLVPFSEFASDTSNGTLPNFSFIVPDACHDAHDCALTNADDWLKKNISPLIGSTNFKKNGLLVILFDEGQEKDKTHGGGQDPLVMVGPHVKAGYQSPTFYQHQNLFKTLTLALGLPKFPGLASSTAAMSDFFTR